MTMDLDDVDDLDHALHHKDMEEASRKAQEALKAAQTRPLTSDEVAAIRFAGRLYQ